MVRLASGRVAEYPYIFGVQQFKVPVGEALGEVLSPPFAVMLLRYAIPVMAQFMHEHVEQHVCSGLGFSEPTDNFLLEQIVRHTQTRPCAHRKTIGS